MLVATWNVNSLPARLDRVLRWLERRRPDVVGLQETKVPDEQFPRAELEALGYSACFSGEKGRNGVAILSRRPATCVVSALPGGHEDDHRRFMSAKVGDATILNVYVPNGQGVATEAFFYKLDWLSRLLAHVRAAHRPDEPLVLMGDFNVCPTDLDVYSPEAFRGRLHCTDHERRPIQFLHQWGLVDALRARSPDQGGLYSWYDYKPYSLKRNDGLRIDLILVTKPLLDRLESVEIDTEERKPGPKTGTKPSDHCPVIARFRDG